MSSDDSKFDFDDDIFRDKRKEEDSYKENNSDSYPPEEPEDYSNEEDEEIKPEDDFFTDADFEFKDYDSEYDEDDTRSSRTKKRSRKRRLIISTIIIMAILVGVAIGIVFGYRWIKNRFFSSDEVVEQGAIAVPESLVLGQDISIVISGAGEDLLEPEINAVIFSKYSSAQNQLTSLTMPATTLMEIPGFGLDSVDRSVEFGGMDLMKLTLKDNIGMDVGNYLLIDIFNTVNTLEGINLELDEPLSFQSASGDTVQLQQGSNIINGETAIGFFNYHSGLAGEISAQQTHRQKLLMDTIISKIVGSEEGKLAESLSKISEFIDTDLNLEELSKVLSTFSNIPSGNDKVYGLDITPVEIEGNLFYVPDITRVADIFNTEITVEEETEAAVTQTVTVTVLNGVGTPGIAGQTSELLKATTFDTGLKKYDVQNVGDADNYNYEITQILVSSEEAYAMTAAEDIKSILKAGEIKAQQDASLATDIVIILGQDYDYNAAAAEFTGTVPEEEDTTATVTSIVKVNILNGEGTAGLASTVNDILTEYFNQTTQVIDVAEVKDADNYDYQQTVIRVFSEEEGMEQVAQQIKDVLGVGVIEKSDNNVDQVDISIVLGSDYTNN